MTPRIRLSDRPAATVAAEVDAIAIPVAAGTFRLDMDLGTELHTLVAGVLGAHEHSGAVGEVLPVHAAVGTEMRRALLYGVGDAPDLDGARLRSAHQFLVRAARKLHYRRLAVILAPPLDHASLGGVAEGCLLGTWDRRSRVSTEPERVSLEELVLAGFGPGRERELETAGQLAAATNRARELQNTPANELTPARMADGAVALAERHGLEAEVLGPREMRERGYHLLLAVSAGSGQEPRLVTLTHSGGSRGQTLALVGKGITFDTGGISLKPPENMHLMKADMAGAAAVLSAMDVIAARRVPATVLGVIACTENMPGGDAVRPGDVITSALGKTVEVVNTDAEGRLVLADAITHAISLGATSIVDLATLTGGARVALGHAVTAVVANDERIWNLVREGALLAGERVSRLPMDPDYRTLLRSRIADIKNSDYGEVPTIMGALFIHEFVQRHPWAHLDIAASAWNTNEDLRSVPLGPSGAGTRTIVHVAELFAEAAR